MAQVERWEQGRGDFIDGNLLLQDIDPAALSDADLAEHVLATTARVVEGMTLHFDLITQAAPVGEYLLALDEWGIDRGVGAKAAFHGVQVTAESNARFDASLRARDPRWGVRDLEAVVAAAEAVGLRFDERVAMPANNQIVVLRAGPTPA